MCFVCEYPDKNSILCKNIPPITYDISHAGKLTFTLEDIKKLCLEYDKEYDNCFEIGYSGQEIYAFIADKLDVEVDYTEWHELTKKRWEKDD